MPVAEPTATSPWLWGGFSLFVLVMLALDLGVFHRQAHAIRKREALAWSLAWIALAMLFNGLVYYFKGPVAAAEFFAGYVVEKSLSVDNLFVFLVIFNYFHLSPVYQHRVLYWGIIGALLMRGVFIAIGSVLLAKVHAVIYVFGAFLVFTGIKLCFEGEKEPDISDHFVIRLARRWLPVTDAYDEGRFLVRRGGKLWATPLLVVLLVVEVSDVLFAVDSIPAIFAITQDSFIVYTSNIFAILGLRALYFLLSGMMQQFVFLRYGLAVVLAFVGVKMLLTDVYKIEILPSLGVILGVLVVTIAASLAVGRKEEPACELANVTPGTGATGAEGAAAPADAPSASSSDSAPVPPATGSGPAGNP